MSTLADPTASIAERRGIQNGPASLVKSRCVLIFTIFFFSFTQYDVIIGERVNYLLFTLPLLLGLTTLAQLKAFKTLLFPYRSLMFLAIYVLLALWVFVAAEAVALFNYILLAVNLLTALMLVVLAQAWPRETESALRIFIWINLGALFFQVAWYGVVKDQIDLHHILFPFSRTSEISATDGFGFLRFNGFQLEPGSYAANIGTATMVHYGITRRISVKMLALVLLTLLITRSASSLMYFGVLALTAYVAAFRRHKFHTLLFTPMMILALAGFVFVSGFDDYIANRFLDQNVQQIAQQDGSVRYKLANLNRLVTADADRLLLGSGFLKIDCDACGFVNSNGSGFAMVFFFGLLGAIMIATLFGVAISRSFEAVLFVTMLMLSRHTFVQPTFWIPVTFFFVYPSFMSTRKAAYARASRHHTN